MTILEQQFMTVVPQALNRLVKAIEKLNTSIEGVLDLEKSMAERMTPPSSGRGGYTLIGWPDSQPLLGKGLYEVETPDGPGVFISEDDDIESIMEDDDSDNENDIDDNPF